LLKSFFPIVLLRRATKWYRFWGLSVNRKLTSTSFLTIFCINDQAAFGYTHRL
jgi:hypothetical protein